MKKLFAFLFFVFSVSLFSQSSKDTTFKYDLNFDNKEETIRVTYNENGEDYSIWINNDNLKGKFFFSYDLGVEIMDLNRNDNLREVVVKGYGPSDQSDTYFFQFINGKIVECGHLPSSNGIEATGNSELTEFGWMGFWSIKNKYDFDTKNKTLTRVEQEFYEVNQECEAKNEFKLLTDRDDNSSVAIVLKPKTKLMIIKADISPTCKYEDGSNDDFSCDWYLFRTEDGKTGWCRLKNFQENVDGLIWAG